MIRSIFWKEWREQRATIIVLMAVGCALILGGGAGLFGVTASTEIAFRTPAGHALLMLLVVVANLVCGATLFAGEREGRTQALLDRLPVTRGRLWRAKAAFGLAVCLGQTALLVAAAWWADFFIEDAALWLLFYPALCVVAYCWGLFGSAVAGSALSAVGVAVLAMPFGWYPSMIVCMVIFAENDEGNVVWRTSLSLAISAAIAVGLSAAVYTRWDRRRSASTRRRPSFRVGLSASLWLAWRQARRFALWLAVICVLGGLLFLTPDFWGIMFYPLFSLMVGWVCGIAVFHDEQMNGVARFWGEQRLPAVRLWLAKVAVYGAVAVGASLLMLGPGMLGVIIGAESLPSDEYYQVDYLSVVMSSELPAIDFWNIWPDLLFLWVGYGFVAGHTAGLLFRKPLVAGPIALAAGAGTALLWAPSVVTGGLHLWQVWTPPLIVLLGTAYLSRLWARRRLGTAKGVALVAACLMLAFGTQAAGIAYRVWEIPDAPDRLEVSGFVESLPKPEEDDARRLFLEVAVDFNQALGTLDQPYPTWLDETRDAANADGIMAAVALYPERLDELFAHTWDERLSELPELPLGVIEHPGRTGLRDADDHAPAMRDIAFALILRGIQRQGEGHPEEFLDHLESGLALVRNYRNKAASRPAGIARSQEFDWHAGFHIWLIRLGDRPELLRRALAIWQRHAEEMPDSVEEIGLAEQLIMRNSLANPKDWLPELGILSPFGREPRPLPHDQDVDLMLTAIQVPWEKQRLARSYRSIWSDDHSIDLGWCRGLVRAVDDGWHRARWSSSEESDALTLRRAAVLKAALRLYWAEEGMPARRLQQLVPRYLDAIPEDPYSGERFRYRLSRGEFIEFAGEEYELFPDDGILWSVGSDGVDNGGTLDLGSRGVFPSQRTGGDRIFVVPAP